MLSSDHMSKKIIPVAEWAKQNKVYVRRAWRLIEAKKIPTKKVPIYIVGIPSDFKLPKAKD